MEAMTFPPPLCLMTLKSSVLVLSSHWCSQSQQHYIQKTQKLTSAPKSTSNLTGMFPVSQVVVVADGQVTMGSQIMKPNVMKVRKLSEGVIGRD